MNAFCTHCVAEVSSSSKGPSGTTLDLMYEAVDKKTKQLSLVRVRPAAFRSQLVPALSCQTELRTLCAWRTGIDRSDGRPR